METVKTETEILEKLPAGIEAHYSAGRLCVGRVCARICKAVSMSSDGKCFWCRKNKYCEVI